MKSISENFLFKTLPPTLHDHVRFCLFYIRRFIDEGVDTASAALTFSMMLALVPLTAVSLNILALIPESKDWVIAFERFLEKNLLPDTAANIITTYTLQFTENAAKMTKAGLMMLAITSFLMLHTMEKVLNRFWQVDKPRAWPRRIMLYSIMIALSPIMVGGLFLGINSLLRFLLSWFNHPNWLVSIVYPSAEFMILALVLTFIYITLPNAVVYFRPAFLAGLFSATGIFLARYLFSLYLAHFPSYSLLYGVFAVLPIFLIWQYFTWLIVLAGSLLSACLQNYKPALTH